LEMVQYLRTLFLVRLGEQENVQSSEKTALREKLLSTAEEGGRNVLRNLQLIEEVTAV
jgi:superfamily II DNA or RNA helicase